MPNATAVAEGPRTLAGLTLPNTNDTLAERLRRRPAKPMGSPRVGSNPTGVDLIGWGDSRACSAAPHYAGFRLLTIEARSGSVERAAAKGGITPPAGIEH